MAYGPINHDYFGWLCSLVDDQNRYPGLLRFLDSVIFVAVEPMDSNREADGRYMRYVYSYDGVSYRFVRDDERGGKDGGPCTCLEMFVGFAYRLGNDDGTLDIGLDPTVSWFWHMMHNIGLDTQSGEYIDEGYCARLIENFMYRNYDEYGRGGGAFVVDGPQRYNGATDMRDIELWWQASWYYGEKGPYKNL